MAITLASMERIGNQLSLIKSYEPFIHDRTCDELQACAQKLNLKCLIYLDAAQDCILNDSQRTEIVSIEIPLMRATKLSKKAQAALDDLEQVINDIDDPYAFLYMEAE